MSENSIEFSLSNSEQRDSWLNSGHRTLDADILGMHISHDCKNWKIFIDQCEYLEKVLVHFNIATNPTHTSLLSEFSFKPNKKQCDPKFCQKY